MANQQFVFVLFGVACLVFPFAGAGFAEEPTYELKVAEPMGDFGEYTESFPTDVEATARLWRQIKVDAVEEQTRAFREDFERTKAVWFGRPENLAEQTGIVSAQMQPQLGVGEQMLYSSTLPAIRFGGRHRHHHR